MTTVISEALLTLMHAQLLLGVLDASSRATFGLNVLGRNPKRSGSKQNVLGRIGPSSLLLPHLGPLTIANDSSGLLLDALKPMGVLMVLTGSLEGPVVGILILGAIARPA